MRPLGLGRIVDMPEPLYDVRDERGELVGYTVHNPSQYGSRGVVVEVIDPISVRDLRSHYVVRQNRRSIEIIAPLFRWPDSEPRIGWRVMLTDVPDLIRVKWIQVLGEDNIHRAMYEAEYRAMRREDEIRFGKPLIPAALDD